MKKNSLFHTAIVISFWLACAVVATLSLMPVNELPRITMDLWDKAQHATGFFLLGALGFWAYPQRPGRLVFGLLVFGALIEVAQAVSGWRSGDVLDWLADAVGIGLSAVALARKTLRQH